MLSTSANKIGLPAGVEFIERDWLSANMVLGFDPDGATLIDSGYVKHADLAVRLVGHALAARHGLPLRTLINTHLHSDHCGGNAALARRFGCEIRVPESQADNVARWDEEALTFRGTAQRCERFQAQGVVRPGDMLRFGGVAWHALAAPGHDPHTVILHCPEHRLLISADALWENGFGVIFPELQGESGFAEQQAVLDLIASLDVDVVIPGHGPMFSDIGPALERARSRLRALREDPRRNARHALKVMLKYLLLDLEGASLDELIALTAQATILRDAAARIGMSLADALRTSAAELLAAGVIQLDGKMLVN